LIDIGYRAAPLVQRVVNCIDLEYLDGLLK